MRMLVGLCAAAVSLGVSIRMARGEDPPRDADPQAETKDETMSDAAAATPSVGASIRGQPNLFDLEFVTARFTLQAPDKALTTVTVAPFLRPPYRAALSEFRLGVHAESSGAFGLGIGWGYNQARARLARWDLPTLADRETPEQRAKRAAASAVTSARVQAAVLDVCRTASDHMSCASGAVCIAAKAVASGCAQGRGDSPWSVFAGKLAAPFKKVPPETDLSTDGSTASGEIETRVAFFLAMTEMILAMKDHGETTDAAAEKADDAVLTAVRKKRLDQAYCRSLGLNVFVVNTLFPVVSAPEIAPMQGEGPGMPRDVFAGRFRSLDVGGAVRLHVNRAALVQLRGGLRWDRTSAVVGTKTTSEYYAGLDVAAVKLRGDGPDEAGFQSGVGGGLSVVVYRCLEAGGCATELGIGDEYPKTASLNQRAQLTGFVEWRLRKEFQTRVALDLIVDDVEGQITGTPTSDVDPRIIHLTPSIAVGSSFWGL